MRGQEQQQIASITGKKLPTKQRSIVVSFLDQICGPLLVQQATEEATRQASFCVYVDIRGSARCEQYQIDCPSEFARTPGQRVTPCRRRLYLGLHSNQQVNTALHKEALILHKSRESAEIGGEPQLSETLVQRQARALHSKQRMVRPARSNQSARRKADGRIQSPAQPWLWRACPKRSLYRVVSR